MGDVQITTQNLRVMQVREGEHLLILRGSVPGSNGSYLLVRPAIKTPLAKAKT